MNMNRQHLYLQPTVLLQLQAFKLKVESFNSFSGLRKRISKQTNKSKKKKKYENEYECLNKNEWNSLSACLSVWQSAAGLNVEFKAKVYEKKVLHATVVQQTVQKTM